MWYRYRHRPPSPTPQADGRNMQPQGGQQGSHGAAQPIPVVVPNSQEASQTGDGRLPSVHRHFLPPSTPTAPPLRPAPAYSQQGQSQPPASDPAGHGASAQFSCLQLSGHPTDHVANTPTLLSFSSAPGGEAEQSQGEEEEGGFSLRLDYSPTQGDLSEVLDMAMEDLTSARPTTPTEPPRRHSQREYTQSPPLHTHHIHPHPQPPTPSPPESPVAFGGEEEREEERVVSTPDHSPSGGRDMQIDGQGDIRADSEKDRPQGSQDVRPRNQRDMQGDIPLGGKGHEANSIRGDSQGVNIENGKVGLGESEKEEQLGEKQVGSQGVDRAQGHPISKEGGMEGAGEGDIRDIRDIQMSEGDIRGDSRVDVENHARTGSQGDVPESRERHSREDSPVDIRKDSGGDMQADSEDDKGLGGEGDVRAGRQGNAQAHSQGDARVSDEPNPRTGSQAGMHAGSRGDRPAGSQGDIQAGGPGDIRAGSQGDIQAGSPGDIQAGSQRDRPVDSQGDIQAGSQRDIRAGTRRDRPAGSQGDMPPGSQGGVQPDSHGDIREHSPTDIRADDQRNIREDSPADIQPGSQRDIRENIHGDMQAAFPLQPQRPATPSGSLPGSPQASNGVPPVHVHMSSPMDQSNQGWPSLSASPLVPSHRTVLLLSQDGDTETADTITQLRDRSQSQTQGSAFPFLPPRSPTPPPLSPTQPLASDSPRPFLQRSSLLGCDLQSLVERVKRGLPSGPSHSQMDSPLTESLRSIRQPQATAPPQQETGAQTRPQEDEPQWYRRVRRRITRTRRVMVGNETCEETVTVTESVTFTPLRQRPTPPSSPPPPKAPAHVSPPNHIPPPSNPLPSAVPSSPPAGTRTPAQTGGGGARARAASREKKGRGSGQRGRAEVSPPKGLQPGSGSLVGLRVFAVWEDGMMYPGTVVGEDVGGRYTVTFADQDRAEGLLIDNLHRGPLPAGCVVGHCSPDRRAEGYEEGATVQNVLEGGLAYTLSWMGGTIDRPYDCLCVHPADLRAAMPAPQVHFEEPDAPIRHPRGPEPTRSTDDLDGALSSQSPASKKRPAGGGGCGCGLAERECRALGPMAKRSDLFVQMGYVVTHRPTQRGADRPGEMCRQHVVAQIESGGGTVFNSVRDMLSAMNEGTVKHCFLLSDVPATTFKYMEALAGQVPCVSYRWVATCCSRGQVVSMNRYLLPAGKSAVTGQTMPCHYRHRQGLLNGLVVMVMPPAKGTKGSYWGSVVELAGGRAVSKATQMRECSHVLCVPGQAVPDAVLARARAQGIVVVALSWLLQSLIHGEILSANQHPSFTPSD